MGKKLFDALQAGETILELKKETERERERERVALQASFCLQSEFEPQ